MIPHPEPEIQKASMRRVSRQPCEDGPLPEEQETEGQRQLHNLLVQQLHTEVDIDRCVAKKQCFAPSSLYRPFGDQAAGVRSLSQFQALQDGEKELAGLRELGLTDAEIQLWRSRDAAEKVKPPSHGVCAAPGAKQQRLQVIRDKIEARAELLARPQRFAASRPLSRREMEIERALFQGNDRLGFLTALYHRDEDNQESQQGATSSDPMDSLYRDVLHKGRRASLREEPAGATRPSTHRTESDQSQNSQTDDNQSEDASAHQSEPQGPARSSPDTSELQQHARDRPGEPRINISRPIGSLRGAAKAGSGGPLTVRGDVETVTDDDILKNRESDDGIRSVPRFRNYQPGKPSEVSAAKSSHDSVRCSDYPDGSLPFQTFSVVVVFFFLAVGSVREELEHAGVSGPAGGAVLQIRAEERAAGRLPAADREDEGSGLHHSARRGNGPECLATGPWIPVARETFGG
ncbi:RNA-binding protein 41 isoform X1 [Brachyistius frenatus]|uniref:RNA-binding protein 41 isoform X1 n=1 Tax=Brachyistius frenatus TaxID=100188 RepID=UPI0037E88DAD